MDELENVQFTPAGELPQSDHPWHIKTALGRVWFVNQDHPPMCLVDGELVMVVRSEDYPDAPLITAAV